MISVLILTKNEEINLGDCLKSVSFSDDVLVFDSFSTDSTCSIARKNGARIIQNKFIDYGTQRQAALQKGSFKYPWLLVLDADERVDNALFVEIKNLLLFDHDYVGFRIRRKDFFENRWIPHATLYPTWHLRFFKVSGARYELRSVHEHPILTGKIGFLKGHLLHYSFNKGHEDWVIKHLNYAKLEGIEAARLVRQPLDWYGLLINEPGRRRRAMKALSYRFPARGYLRFLYMIFIKFSFLDGLPGIKYSLLISSYERQVSVHMRRALREF